MATIHFVRNTPLYLSTILVKINGETHKLRGSNPLELELPAGSYELLVCNDYELFEGKAEVNLTDETPTELEVRLTNGKMYQFFILLLLLIAFVCLFFLKLPTLLWGFIIFISLAIYWGIEYLTRKNYFDIRVNSKNNS